MNNQPRPNSDQESQEQIDRTVELLESLNHPSRQQSLDAEQQSIVELATAARASVATQLPESNQALRRQLIEAMGNGPPATASRHAVTSFPIKRWATAAALMVGLGLSGWYLSGFKTSDFALSGVASKNVLTETDASMKEVDVSKKPTSVFNEAPAITNSDDLLDVASVSEGDTFTGITVDLPNVAETSISTVVTVPDGGTVMSGGIKRNAKQQDSEMYQSEIAKSNILFGDQLKENSSRFKSALPSESESRSYGLSTLGASDGKELKTAERGGFATI